MDSSQAILHLLLKISDSVKRLESLLLITAPEEEDNDSEGMSALRINTSADEQTEDPYAPLLDILSYNPNTHQNERQSGETFEQSCRRIYTASVSCF
jgi:hypothetical protein